MKNKDDWHFVPENFEKSNNVRFGIDTGQILIGDPCYIRELLNSEDGERMLRDHQEVVYKSSKSGVGLVVKLGCFGGDGIFNIRIERDCTGSIAERIIIEREEVRDCDLEDY